MMASSRRVVSFDVSRCSSQPFGPLLAWKRGDLLGALQRLYLVAALAFTAAVIVFYLEHGGPVLSVLGLAAGLFLILGALPISGIGPASARSPAASPGAA